MCGLVCLLGKRGGERRKKKDHFIFSAGFNLLLDQIQSNGDLTYFCDEEVQKTQVFISWQPGGASISISAHVCQNAKKPRLQGLLR